MCFLVLRPLGCMEAGELPSGMLAEDAQVKGLRPRRSTSKALVLCSGTSRMQGRLGKLSVRGDEWVLRKQSEVKEIMGAVLATSPVAVTVNHTVS